MPKNILIVDDFETTVFTVGFTLEGKGYKVFKSSNGKEALSYLDGREINLIISDYNMPEMNGVELTEAVRKMDDYHRVPILILSTDTSPEKKKDALSKGATGWIQKPYQLDDFMKIINRVIN